MSKKAFLTYKIITAVVLGIIVGVSVNRGNWYLPVIFLIAAFAFLSILKRKVKEAMADERDYKAAGRASYMAITAYAMISAISGITLFIAGRQDPVLFVSGNILLYSACFVTLLYAVLFKIYVKRKDEEK